MTASTAAAGASALLVLALVDLGRRRPARRPSAPRRASSGPRSTTHAEGDRRARRPQPRAGRVGAGVASSVVVAVALGPAALILLSAAAAAALGTGAARRRRAARAVEAAIVDALPDVVDLLRLGVGAGLGPVGVLQAILPGDTPVHDAVGAALAAAHAGRPLADVCHRHLDPLGEGGAALAHVLADHLRYGTPLEPELARLGQELRTTRRHRAERTARQVPVRLLLPLVACVLPAFALLTVVPLLAGSLQGVLG